MEPTLRRNYEKALEILRTGQAGKNQHPLGNKAGRNLTGYKAIDIPGTGDGRGGMRIIYQETENEIILHSVENYH